MPPPQQSIGRYVVCDEIAAGGMATVHFGRVVGAAGFTRTVAIKKMHAHCAREPQFATMFLDEARLAARIHHPNVVATLDVVSHDGDLFIVIDYIEGETLARLSAAASALDERVPVPFALSILIGALSGLHAAHEATGERREPLRIVHRDVSPQNLIIGVDGVTRVLDFGIAKAAARLESTRGGQVKGKLRYMAPEQIRQQPLDRRVDVYAAGVVLWEALAGRRLFAADESGAILHQILHADISPPSTHAQAVSPDLDAITLRALARDPEARYPTALAMAEALERIATPVKLREVGAWVQSLAGETLRMRADRIVELESAPMQPVQIVTAASASIPRRVTRGDDPTSMDAAPAASLSATQAPKENDAVRRYGPAIVLAAALATVAIALARRPGGAEAEADRGAERAASASSEAAATPLVVPVSATVASSSSAAPADPPVPVATEGMKPISRPPPVNPSPADCVPPYVIEADGTKRYKKHCF